MVGPIRYPDSNVNFPAIFRGATLPIAAAVMTSVFAPPEARAQSADSAWQTYLMQALYAAGARDYPKSEGLFKEALHEAERFGPDDARIGTTLNSFGLVYRAE